MMTAMDTRQEVILKAIVKEYIKTAEPVSSGILTKKYSFGVSPATIRNDMAELEKQGFIVQPHTSAGRIPTEKGYRNIIADYMQTERQIAKNEQQAMRRHVPQRLTEDALRDLARTLAMLSRETVVIGFGPHAITAGIANLLRQPEFSTQDLIQRIAMVLDQIDELVHEIGTEELPHDVSVLIGQQSPFGLDLGAVVTHYGEDEEGNILCILGPVRMNYRDNIARLSYLKTLLNDRA